MRIRNYAVGYLDRRSNLYLGKQRFLTRTRATTAAWQVGHSSFDYFCVDLREIESEERKETEREARFLITQYERLHSIVTDLDEPSLLDRFKIQLLDMEKVEW